MMAVRSGGSWSGPTAFAPYAGQTAMAAGGSGTPRVLLGRGDAVYEATGDERVSKHYVAGSRVATRLDGELYFIIPDHLGSTTVVADATGAEVGRAIYDPYGGILTSTIPLTVTDRLFTGQRWDATIGLYDYNARFYDPQAGTFIQPDSIVPDPGNPMAWNRFAYVYNDPVNNVDPSGHFVVAAIDTIWDSVDLYSDLRDCLGDSDSMACYMAAAGVGFIAMGALEGPSNNVARRAAKAADVGEEVKLLPAPPERKLLPTPPERKLLPPPPDPSLPPGRIMGYYDYANPGPLPDELAATFTGHRYTAVELESIVLNRAGISDRPLGQFFSRGPAVSEVQVRIDRAIRPRWPGGATSPIDTVFEIRFPKGTIGYVGEIAYQGGFYIGLTEQIVIVRPWNISGVEILSSRPIK
jgi:RHS repeat-associated protein